MDERERLTDGARRLGLELAPAAVLRLLRLIEELERWNRAYSLTALRGREALITHHLLDSLAIHADLRGPSVADVGTGAGFPGLPLAIARPELAFTLIDSNQKKIRFVAHAQRTLALANVTPLHARVESLALAAPFATVTARAFAALPELLAQVSPLCGPGTRLLAMKGRLPRAELAGIGQAWAVVEVRELQVPGLDAVRHLLVLERRDR
ncbi:MAG TPA: 16S rRNA (guanine(527)-N(7))-methyltransferase RsmG [Steroidobacteraceae bacterium]|nr:16S rRNA (guanine(527)-N(7))-methyltransferase RsmG [Steroidobacteraceae bacterium]